ncbi:MAG: hypothetical protein QXX12_02220 [Nanopusillaceae archaeon]
MKTEVEGTLKDNRSWWRMTLNEFFISTWSIAVNALGFTIESVHEKG